MPRLSKQMHELGHAFNCYIVAGRMIEDYAALAHLYENYSAAQHTAHIHAYFVSRVRDWQSARQEASQKTDALFYSRLKGR